MLGLLDAFLRGRPRVTGWFDRIRERASFREAVLSWFSEDDADRFAPCETDSAEKVAALLLAGS